MFHIFLLRKIIYQINIMINIATNCSYTIHREKSAETLFVYLNSKREYTQILTEFILNQS